jgi:hypothetical protein
MNFGYWLRKLFGGVDNSIPSQPPSQPPLKPGQFYCRKCGKPTFYEMHKPFCSAECKFNLTGANHPVIKPPARGTRHDEQRYFCFHAHGVKFGNRQTTIKSCVRGNQVQLVREPNNFYDKFAIRIVRDGRELGYVPREDAATLAPMLDAGGQVRAEIDWINQPDGEFPAFGAKIRVGVLKGDESR